MCRNCYWSASTNPFHECAPILEYEENTSLSLKIALSSLLILEYEESTSVSLKMAFPAMLFLIPEMRVSWILSLNHTTSLVCGRSQKYRNGGFLGLTKKFRGWYYRIAVIALEVRCSPTQYRGDPVRLVQLKKPAS